MATPLGSVEAGLSALLNSITYTKQSGGTANVPYIGSKSITPYKYYPIVKLDDINLEPDDSKSIKYWEVEVVLSIITSTQTNHGSNYDVNVIEASIDSLMRDEPYALSITGFDIREVMFEQSIRDELLTVVDTSNGKAKPQRVISRDLVYNILLNENN